MENLSQHLADPLHPYDQIVRYRHQDGHTVWIRCRGLAIRNKEGKATRMLGAHTDVTSLKEKEKELEKTKHLLEEMGSMAQLGGWEFDLATEKITWTKTTLNIHEADPGFTASLATATNFYYLSRLGVTNAVYEPLDRLNFITTSVFGCTVLFRILINR